MFGGARQFGFELVDGPEVDSEFPITMRSTSPSTTLLETCKTHFGFKTVCPMRSHTTTVQARVLGEGRELPIRVASAGQVYRNEAVDATHLAMFHQLEGVWVTKD